MIGDDKLRVVSPFNACQRRGQGSLSGVLFPLGYLPLSLGKSGFWVGVVEHESDLGFGNNCPSSFPSSHFFFRIYSFENVGVCLEYDTMYSNLKYHIIMNFRIEIFSK